MDYVTTRKSAVEVQQAAGFDKVHWTRFKTITAEEYAKLKAYSPEYWEGENQLTFTSWRTVPNLPQRRLLERVNRRLADESIPEVNQNVIDWRMQRLLRVRQGGSKSQQLDKDDPVSADAEGEMDATPDDPPLESNASGGTAGQTRAYWDPVHDAELQQMK